jgi:hypothetical protein
MIDGFGMENLPEIKTCTLPLFDNTKKDFCVVRVRVFGGAGLAK